MPFLYSAAAVDPDGGVPLRFDLPVHPRGMAVDPELGVVAWQLQTAQRLVPGGGLQAHENAGGQVIKTCWGSTRS
jgi:hypothetical protein